MPVRLTAIFLLFLMLTGLGGYFFIFKMEQWQIRREVKGRLKKQIPDTELHVITVENGEEGQLDWVREGKEFRHNGEMYDIVKTEFGAGKTRYYCISDLEEKTLFKYLDELTSQEIEYGHSPAKNKSASLIKLIHALIYLPAKDLLLLPLSDACSRFAACIILYPAAHFGDISHPPEI